jgi:hypothetical protein
MIGQEKIRFEFVKRRHFCLASFETLEASLVPPKQRYFFPKAPRCNQIAWLVVADTVHIHAHPKQNYGKNIQRGL